MPVHSVETNWHFDIGSVGGSAMEEFKVNIVAVVRVRAPAENVAREVIPNVLGRAKLSGSMAGQ